jgi:hypothetical protein
MGQAFRRPGAAHIGGLPWYRTLVFSTRPPYPPAGGNDAYRRWLLTSDQVPAENKTSDSFFPGFWDGMSWGFGVGVRTEGPQQGRHGWSGGQGTDFFVDQDGPVGILFTHVELGQRMSPLLAEFKALHQPT